MLKQWFTCVRLSDSYLTVKTAFYRNVHYHTVTGSAAYGSLKSTPVGRLRWTYHHLRYSIAFSFKRVHGTQDFPSSIPEPESDSRCLNTGHRMACKQVLAMLIPAMRGAPGFDVVLHSYDAS